MYPTKPVNLLGFVISIASAIEHIDPRIANHHKRVAYIASQIAQELGASPKMQHEFLIAGLLHDIGTLSNHERTQLMEFDCAGDKLSHCETGYQLLNKFRSFSHIADIIRHHHTPYVRRANRPGMTVPMESTLLHLADRIDILIDKEQPILEQTDRIIARIARQAGTMFDPLQVDAFTELAWKERFWLDITSPALEQLLLNSCKGYSVELANDDLLDFAELLAHIIDFRCHFTATHSSGVASVASVLANLFGFSETECQKIKVAGYLHDIGKLAIPVEILEKNSTLTAAEFRTVKAHAYYTYRILEPLHELDDIRTWAAMHHERLDGNGYPSRCGALNIPLGARIVAVADVFTALMEARPYRAPLEKSAAQAKISELGQRDLLDRKVIDVLLSNFDIIDTYRLQAQHDARREYEVFRASIGQVESAVAGTA